MKVQGIPGFEKVRQEMINHHDLPHQSLRKQDGGWYWLPPRRQQICTYKSTSVKKITPDQNLNNFIARGLDVTNIACVHLYPSDSFDFIWKCRAFQVLSMLWNISGCILGLVILTLLKMITLLTLHLCLHCIRSFRSGKFKKLVLSRWQLLPLFLTQWQLSASFCFHLHAFLRQPSFLLWHPLFPCCCMQKPICFIINISTLTMECCDSQIASADCNMA